MPINEINLPPEKVKTLLFTLALTAFFVSDHTLVLRNSETDRQTPSVAIAASARHIVSVKYRETPVDLADPRFAYLDTSRSSFVTGAWYDASNSYMIIGLRDTYYHYCRMPKQAWDSFRSTDSFGRHYNAFIKGKYDCRQGGVPAY